MSAVLRLTDLRDAVDPFRDEPPTIGDFGGVAVALETARELG